MTASLDLFRTLSADLDALIGKVDKDLPLAEDIHPLIHDAGVYAAGLVHHPREVAKLEAQKASAEAAIPGREKAVRAARHQVTLLDAKRKKVGERLDHHLNAQSDADDEPVTTTFRLGGKPLPTRREMIEGLQKEVVDVDAEIATAKAALRKAESTLKGWRTRVGNLDEAILIARWAVVDHEGRMEDAVKLLRKAISFLRNRQEKRDRKRAAPAAAEVADAVIVDEVPKAPTDDDIVLKAAAAGLTLDGPDDIAVARELFLN